MQVARRRGCFHGCDGSETLDGMTTTPEPNKVNVFSREVMNLAVPRNRQRL